MMLIGMYLFIFTKHLVNYIEHTYTSITESLHIEFFIKTSYEYQLYVPLENKEILKESKEFTSSSKI